jgi:hypothetical protein
MASSWQSCMGDYIPEKKFKRGNLTVIAKNITETETPGLYSWEEYAIPTDIYENVIASTQALSDKLDDAIDTFGDKALAANILLGLDEEE